MKCPNCGADHPAGTTFCFYCGEPIPENAGDDSGEWTEVGGIEGIGAAAQNTAQKENTGAERESESDSYKSTPKAASYISARNKDQTSSDAAPNKAENSNIFAGYSADSANSSGSGGTGAAQNAGYGTGTTTGGNSAGYGTSTTTGGNSAGYGTSTTTGGSGAGTSTASGGNSAGTGTTTAGTGTGTGKTQSTAYSTGTTTGSIGAGRGIYSTGTTSTYGSVRPRPEKLKTAGLISMLTFLLSFIYLMMAMPPTSWVSAIKSNSLALGRILPTFAYAIAGGVLLGMARRRKYKIMILPLILTIIASIFNILSLIQAKVFSNMMPGEIFRNYLLPIIGTILLILMVTSEPRRRLITSSMAAFYWFLHGVTLFLNMFYIIKNASGEWFISILPTLVMVLWSAAMAVFSTERMSAQ